MSVLNNAVPTLPDGSRHDGIRELLDEFGEEATKLELDLRRVGDHRISDRLIAIAEALRMAVDARTVERITREEGG